MPTKFMPICQSGQYVFPQLELKYLCQFPAFPGHDHPLAVKPTTNADQSTKNYHNYLVSLRENECSEN